MIGDHKLLAQSARRKEAHLRAGLEVEPRLVTGLLEAEFQDTCGNIRVLCHANLFTMSSGNTDARLPRYVHPEDALQNGSHPHRNPSDPTLEACSKVAASEACN